VLFVVFFICRTTYAAAPTVKVMTQNMDAGTDLKFALAYLNTSTPTVGIDLTYQELSHSNFAGRAAILAHEIADAQPLMVSLQEVTLWSTGPNAADQTPMVDQLQLLLGALATLGEDYSVVEVNPLTTVALPMTSGDWLGFLDRDVVLARNNAGLGIENIQKGIFTARLIIPSPLGNIEDLQGWIAADVTLGDNTFTFVDTHLTSTFPGQPQVTQLQEAQAEELALILNGAARVVVAGDFNSNATHTPPEQTQSVIVMLTSGFTDTWSAVNRGKPGFT
jgi:Endonuclease/Exonuclease/phosphatase family